MNKNLRAILFAILLVLALFSLPLWLPGLLVNQVAAQQNVNLHSAGSVILLDGGWTTGETTQRVLAMPQVIAWVPSQPDAAWATETGFLYGGLPSADGNQLYVLEHRKLGEDIVLNMEISESEMFRPNKDWGIFLTALDPNDGRVLSRQQLLDPPNQNYGDVSLFPLALDGKILYLMNYGMRNNVLAYNLESKQFEEQTWSTCERGYLMRAEFIADANSVAALCTDYNEKPKSWVTITSFDSGESQSGEIPALSDQEFETGNGLVLSSDGQLYLLDTDAGVLVEINIQTLQLGETVNYRQALGEQSSLGERFVAWLLRLGAQPAAAKRWMALSALSPDGRWLAVDGGMNDIVANEGKPSVLLIDMQTLQATQAIGLNSTPSILTFTTDDKLLLFFEKGNLNQPTRGVILDLSSGTQASFSIQMHGWLRSVIPIK